MEKSPVPNLTREEKTQTRVSRDDGDEEQSFIPFGGGIEERGGEAHTGVGGEVVQPDIHGEKEEREVGKDLGLQSSKRGSEGKHIKMDSQETMVELLEKNYWMTILDISSAYQHVKVDEQFSPYLCFSFQSQCYANVGMPFRAKDAPRVFTKIRRRAASYIREQWKVKLVIYLDNILLMHPDREVLRSISLEIAQFLKNLGWILSEEKLNLLSTRSV